VIAKAMDGLTFGCDPELFIVDSDGEFVCPDGIIPGTKEEPYPVTNGAVQQDGMAAEFNIDPVTTFEDFERNITTVMAEMKKFLPSGCTFAVTPAAVFSEKVWEKASNRSKELGCTPDFNAWTGSPNPPPEDLDNPRMRCAGGHLHFGWTEGADMSNAQHILACRDLVKQLDFFLGAWSVRMDRDMMRRRLYGKAGSMRFKDYGVEYRTLSNFWLANKSRRLTAWNRMQSAIWSMRSDFLPEIGDQYGLNPALIESINTSKRNTLLENKFSWPIMKCD
jgi:hypothetical protein